MVKLTGDFHSVYYRTKDSLDDINRIMKSTIGEQIESVLQKPNYLLLITVSFLSPMTAAITPTDLCSFDRSLFSEINLARSRSFIINSHSMRV